LVDRAYGSGDILVDRQTHRQTLITIHRNRATPYYLNKC